MMAEEARLILDNEMPELYTPNAKVCAAPGFHLYTDASVKTMADRHVAVAAWRVLYRAPDRVTETVRIYDRARFYLSVENERVGVAEWMAMSFGLRALRQILPDGNAQNVYVYSDALNTVIPLNKRYIRLHRASTPYQVAALHTLWRIIAEQVPTLRGGVQVWWLPRKENRDADKLTRPLLVPLLPMEFTATAAHIAASDMAWWHTVRRSNALISDQQIGLLMLRDLCGVASEDERHFLASATVMPRWREALQSFDNNEVRKALHYTAHVQSADELRASVRYRRQFAIYLRESIADRLTRIGD